MYNIFHNERNSRLILIAHSTISFRIDVFVKRCTSSDLNILTHCVIEIRESLTVLFHKILQVLRYRIQPIFLFVNVRSTLVFQLVIHSKSNNFYLTWLIWNWFHIIFRIFRGTWNLFVANLELYAGLPTKYQVSSIRYSVNATLESSSISRRIPNGILGTYSSQVPICFSRLTCSKIMRFHTPLTDFNLRLPIVAQRSCGYRYCVIFEKGKLTYDLFSSQLLLVYFISHIPMNPKRLATFSGRWFIQWSQSRRCLVYIPWNLLERVARVPTCFCPATSSRIWRALCTCTIDLTTAHHFEYHGIIKLLRNRIDNSNSKFDNNLDTTLCIKYDNSFAGCS